MIQYIYIVNSTLLFITSDRKKTRYKKLQTIRNDNDAMNVVRNEWNNNGKKIRLWMYCIVSIILFRCTFNGILLRG